MRPTRTLPLALLAALAALVSGCAEELVDTDPEPIVGESADTGRGLAADGADGDPPAWEGEDSLPPWDGEGPAPWADDIPGEPDSIVHPTRSRIDLTISTASPLVPDADVVLTIEGVAREEIDSGEVVLTLPTRALMDHAGGKGLPNLPVKARWELPPMAEGDAWSGSHTVAGEAEGWYRAMANAYTHGPDGGLFLFDDAHRSAWMHVSKTDGRLADFFEDDSTPPIAGPAAGWPTGPLARSPDYVGLHSDSVYLHVVYTVSGEDGFRNAVRARIWGELKKEERGWEDLGRVTVPEDGIVAFKCPKNYGEYLAGGGDAPDTYRVQGRRDIANWGANKSHCGEMVQVEVLARRYYPWRLLNLAADTLTQHFGRSRGRIDWKLNELSDDWSYYNFASDKIVLGWEPTSDPFRWVVAHEYGHAYHHKALGGGWFIRSSLQGCLSHKLNSEESHKCALQEGFANYAGTIGSVTADHPGGYYGECFEHLGTPEAPKSWCRNISHDWKPKSESWVAALFLDLTDDTGEEGDYTEYPGKYVAEVFKTCKTKSRYRWMWNPITGWSYFYIWWGRSNVSNIVWCLEEEITPVYHEEDSVFGDIGRPWDVRVQAAKPPNWRWSDIRKTWLKNLNDQ